MHAPHGPRACSSPSGTISASTRSVRERDDVRSFVERRIERHACGTAGDGKQRHRHFRAVGQCQRHAIASCRIRRRRGTRSRHRFGAVSARNVSGARPGARIANASGVRSPSLLMTATIVSAIGIKRALHQRSRRTQSLLEPIPDDNSDRARLIASKSRNGTTNCDLQKITSASRSSPMPFAGQERLLSSTASGFSALSPGNDGGFRRHRPVGDAVAPNEPNRGLAQAAPWRVRADTKKRRRRR